MSVAEIRQDDGVYARPIVKLLLDPYRPQIEPEIPSFFFTSDEDEEGDSPQSPEPERCSEQSVQPFVPVDTLMALVWQQTIQNLHSGLLDTECPIVVVTTPTMTWADLVVKLLTRARSGIGVVQISKPRESEKLAEDHIRRMCPFVIVTHDLTLVPSIIRAGTDLVLPLAAPTIDMLAELVRQASKERISQKQRPQLEALLHYDPYEIAAVVRRGRSRREILTAIGKLSSPNRGDGNVPDLGTSRAFGEAGNWGRQLASDLAAWRRREITWSEVDRGVCLWGPPGTGKTMFARSLANFCGIPLVVASVGQLFTTGDGHLGTVVKQLRKMFGEASARTPSILFFDEIDALPSRDTMDSYNHAWWGTIVTDFLTLLDGAISDREGVIVIGATNVVSKIDPALLRPGRLERKVFLGPPDADGLQDVLRHHLKHDLVETDLTDLCEEAVGATPADAMMAVRDARRIARVARRPLDLSDLRSALHVAEPMSPEIRWRTAVHEAGHALIASHFGRSVHKIFVGRRGNTSGHVVASVAAPFQGTRAEIIDGVRVLLAGRAAEETILGSPSAGCGFGEDSDLAQATNFLTELELSSGLGGLAIIPLKKVPEFRSCSIDVRQSIEQLLRTLYGEVLAYLESDKERLTVIAQTAYEHGKVDAAGCARLLKDVA